MKKYSKPSIIAKNLPSGSYAAGCPSMGRGKKCFITLFSSFSGCADCERTK